MSSDQPEPKPESNVSASPGAYQQIVSLVGGRDIRSTKPVRGSTGDHELDSVGKLAFLRAYLKQVRAAFDNAVVKQMPQPIVFLVDCEDDIGGRIARAWCGDAAVDQQIAARKNGQRPGKTTVLVRALPYQTAQEMVQFDFKYLTEIFPEPPTTDEVCVLIVGMGGAASLFVPAKEEDGNTPRAAE